MIVPVILAGGSGTRLWPLSREFYPKQLINMYNQHTMLQNTVLRLKDLDGLDDPLIVCNDAHRFMTAEQLHQIQVNPQAIILEPVAKNTAPAIALAAIQLMEREKDPVMLVLRPTIALMTCPHFIVASNREKSWRIRDISSHSGLCRMRLKPGMATFRKDLPWKTMFAVLNGLWKSRIWTRRNLICHPVITAGIRACSCSGRPPF